MQIADNQCGGSAQSGIDVPTGACDEFADYTFSAGTCTTNDMNYTLAAHAIQATYLTDNCEAPRMTIPGQPNPFEAVQFHIHTGSDHAIDGVYFGADVHLVHKEIDGDRFSVLGFFLEPTNPSDSPVFGNLLAGWEAVANATAEVCADAATQSVGDRVRAVQEVSRELAAFDYYSLMPEGATMYQYDGSLTTPPCSEVVFWNVVDTPVSISVREYVSITSFILNYVDPATCQPASIAAPSGFTGRPVQPINGRPITRVCPSNLEGVLPNSESEGESGSGRMLSSVKSATLGLAGMLF